MDKNNKELNLDFLANNSVSNIPPPEEFSVFKKKIAALINLDLTNYKNTQMERRITSLMKRNQIENLNDYYNLLKTDPTRLNEFINMLTINVTEFFRNPEKFKELETIYLPELLKKNPRLKIWSSGCSIGAEIYTLAMLLDKMNVLDNCTLIASDFDDGALNKAKSGIYAQFEYATVPDEYKKHFKDVDNTGKSYKIDSKYASKVLFKKQDLLNSTFDADYDLILCRNVVIYFTEEAKDKLYEKFYTSLKTDGILFIGSTERINKSREIGYKLRSSFFYQK